MIVILDTFCIELSWHYSHPLRGRRRHVVLIGRRVLGWRAGSAVYDQSLARFPVTNATENTEATLV